MRIEKVLASDAKELLDIYGYYVEKTAISFEYVVPTEEEFKERIINISSKYPYIKAVDDNGKILGYAYAGSFKARAAYDWSVETTVYVKQTERRMGVGKALYEALENMLKEMGILNMNACIAVPECDEDEHLTWDSKRFHKIMGFKEVGTFTKSGLKFDTWYNMIWMEKLIGEHGANPEKVKFGKW